MNFLQKKLIKLASLSLLFPAIRKAFHIWRTAKGKTVVVAALAQHLGDNIAAEPLDSQLKKDHPNDFLVRVVGNSFVSVVSNNPNIDLIVPVDCLSEWVYLKPMLKLFTKVYDYHVHQTFCPKYRLIISNSNSFGINDSNYYNYGNLLAVFCMCSGHEIINERPLYRFPTSIHFQDLPEKFAVIHTSSNNEQREWVNEKWLLLIEYFAATGFVVIEVGLKSSLQVTHPSYKDYCGKLSLVEIAFLISKCNYFIGIDSAFAHFANAFNVPRLILLGHFNQFKNYLPYSGLDKEEEKRTIIHYNGPVKELPFETVKEKILL